MALMRKRTIWFTAAAVWIIACGFSRAAAPTTLPSVTPGLMNPAKKEIAMQLVSAAENSSLDWKAQYAYIEYNVEHNAKENRGYTAGIIGFTSATHGHARSRHAV